MIEIVTQELVSSLKFILEKFHRISLAARIRNRTFDNVILLRNGCPRVQRAGRDEHPCPLNLSDT